MIKAVVFDAYKVKGGQGSVEKYHNIHVIYTKEAETADAFIEKATYELGRKHRVRVATSDGPEQLIILGHGALRMSASHFREEMEQVEGQISRLLDKAKKLGIKIIEIDEWLKSLKNLPSNSENDDDDGQLSLF